MGSSERHCPEGGGNGCLIPTPRSACRGKRPREAQVSATVEGVADARRVPDDLWTLDDVAAYFKVRERTIRDWRDHDATFPAPLDLPGRSVRWYRVVEWARCRGVGNWSDAPARRKPCRNCVLRAHAQLVD
jgi:hypothetical protein